LKSNEKCGTCRFYRACANNSMPDQQGCHYLPTVIIKSADDWCGQWKALKNSTIKVEPVEKINAVEAQQLPTHSHPPEELTKPAPAKTHAELTAQVAEILKTRKLSIIEFSKILEENGLTNLQDLASTPEKIPVISGKIAEVTKCLT
jgi:hypothetical protein